MKVVMKQVVKPKIQKGIKFLLMFVITISCKEQKSTMSNNVDIIEIEKVIPNIKVETFSLVDDSIKIDKSLDEFPPYRQVKVFCNFNYREMLTYNFEKSNFAHYELDCIKSGEKVKISYYRHKLNQKNIDFISDIKKIYKNDCFNGEGKARFSFTPIYGSNYIDYVKITEYH